METINKLLETIGEDYGFLSDNAKQFLKNNLEHDDLIEFERLISYYQLLVKDTDQYDDFDNELLEKLKISLGLLKTHLE